MTGENRSVLIAVGGNALIEDGEEGTIEQQAANAARLAPHVAAIAAAGWRTVVTHGNGPQVGFILLRSELVSRDAHVPELDLHMCVADSQGGIGHLLTSALTAQMAERGLVDRVAYLLTHTVVDRDDPAFTHPAKPIGRAYTHVEAEERQRSRGWAMVEEQGRGFRRVVPSPRPRRIVQKGQVEALLDAGYVVIAAGGGGIPVVEDEPGVYRGVEAVVDKDHASVELALALGVRRLVVSTGVERVALDYGTPQERPLDELSVSDARRHLEAGQFPPGSMGPKIEAALTFLERGGEDVLVTSPDALERAFDGRTGTRIRPDATAAAETSHP